MAGSELILIQLMIVLSGIAFFHHILLAIWSNPVAETITPARLGKGSKRYEKSHHQ